MRRSESPYIILDPVLRWFPADEALRQTSMDKLMPPLVSGLRPKVKEWRDSGYVGATDTSKSMLNWWFNTPHLLPQAYLPSTGRFGIQVQHLDPWLAASDSELRILLTTSAPSRRLLPRHVPALTAL